MKRLAAAAGLLASLLATSASGAAAPDVSEARIRNADIVAKTPGADGVFGVEDNGDIRHVQSGLRCPAAFPTVAFSHAEIFSPPGLGTDMGCDYAREDAQGHAVTKLTIFATKVGDASIDQVFASDRAGLEKASPGAKYKGPALTVGQGAAGKSAPSPFGEFRSAEYAEVRGGAHYLSDLIVAVRAGWALEIRATFPTDVAAGATKEQLAKAMAMVNGDNTVAVIAFGAAITSVGIAGSPPNRP